MFNSENLQEKWQKVLEHGDLPEIKDSTSVKSLLLSWKTKKKHSKKMLLS